MASSQPPARTGIPQDRRSTPRALSRPELRRARHGSRSDLEHSQLAVSIHEEEQSQSNLVLSTGRLGFRSDIILNGVALPREGKNVYQYPVKHSLCQCPMLMSFTELLVSRDGSSYNDELHLPRPLPIFH